MEQQLLDFFKINRKDLLYKLTRYTKCHETSEDLLQDSFLKAWRNLDQYDPEKGTLKTWFNSVMFSILWDSKRKIKKQPSIVSVDSISESEALDIEENPLMKLILNTRNETHKVILFAHYILGYSVEEIESTVDQSKSNIRKILQRFQPIIER